MQSVPAQPPEMSEPAAQPQDLGQKSREDYAQRIVSLVHLAFELTRTAVTAATDALAGGRESLYADVRRIEGELDALDREVDEHVKHAVPRAAEPEVRQLLACMKFMTDLERIGDLLLSFSSRAQAMRTRLDMEDTGDLIRMGAALHQMLGRIHDALRQRDITAAVEALRADGEIDRLRNLIYLRRLEQSEGVPVNDTIQVFFMAQALERAGDHAKNLAEEVCHLASGHTMRHVLRAHSKSYEQMYLEYTRRHGAR